jgi:gluconolactonase
MTSSSASAPAPVLVARIDAHEGPVYAPDGDALYFTTVRRERVAIKRLALRDGSLTVVRPDANMANGMCAGSDGGLFVCEQGTLLQPARITRLDPSSGRVEPVVDSFFGLPLNSPNDVVARSDGTIWFTDPSYGWLQGFRPAPRLADRVYRYDLATGSITSVTDALDKPNGLAFSRDERVLYVGDSGAIHGPDDYDPARPRRVLAFDVVNGGLATERVFADDIPGFPDGIKVDVDGRVYVSCAEGVLVFAPDGRPLDEIPLPGAVNFTFGGPGRDVLFITADTAVWAVHLKTEGD